MLETRPGQLADRELVLRLEQERDRLRWSLLVQQARWRGPDGAIETPAPPAEIAEWQAGLDRLGEIEASLDRLAAGGLERCQECGAPLYDTALEVLGWSVSCAWHGQRDLVGAGARQIGVGASVRGIW